MATQKFSHLSSKYTLIPLGTLTMNGSIANAGGKYFTEPIDKAMIALSEMVLTGTLTVTVVGSTSATAASGFTTIKEVAFGASGATAVAVEFDSEEVSYAEDKAGVTFKTVAFRLTGTNTNTVKAAILALTFHRRKDQTPTGTGVTT